MSDDISGIMVNPMNGFGSLKAIASLNYKGVILRGLKLFDKDGTLWLGMARRKKNETWEDVYFFPDRETKDFILNAIIEKYKLAQTN